MIINHFQGDALEIEGELLNDAGAPINFAAEGVTVTAMIRLADDTNDDPPLDTFTVSYPTATSFYLSRAFTSSWPATMLVMNIRYIKGGKAFSSDVVQINCERSPTR